jgi:hypothetical protein
MFHRRRLAALIRATRLSSVYSAGDHLQMEWACHFSSSAIGKTFY